MKHRWIIAVIAAVLLILTGMIVIRQRSIHAQAHSTTGHDACCPTEEGGHTEKADITVEHADAHEGVKVAGLETVSVVLAHVTAQLSVTGEVQHNEDQTARVGSPVSGRLTHLAGKVGQRVHAGQTLATVASRDVADVQSALIRAHAEEQAARAKLANIKELAATGAFTQRPLEDAEAAFGSAQAEVKQAEAALARARNARELAANDLERKQKLAKANAYHGPQIEAARGAVAEAQAELESARAAAKVKQTAYDRGKRLFDAGIAARREVEAAEADLEDANAKEKEARTHLDIARQTLAREENIAGQGLYTSAETKAAESALHQTEREVDTCEAALQRAKGQLTVAQSVLAREKQVAGKSLLAKQEIQGAEAELARARAEVQAAENALRALRVAGASGNAVSIPITAPISGIITERQATPGQAVEASSDLFTIINTNHVWVWANVYEKDLAQVRLGQATEITVASFPGKMFRGVVRHIGTGMNAETRTARIRCDVANPGSALKAGMFATVNIATGKGTQALLIPKTAVLDEAGKKIVFSPCMDCEDDQASGKSCGSFDKLEVTLGTTHGDKIEVINGLEPGLDVVTTGNYQLKTAFGSGTLEAGCADH
ncbi:MAG: Cobalt-zinc-cadmium resistance protein CzcB [bacterium ADurb.Bin429]|nr:MAG: Cobalt-zinc-cadmium resistance protein CzcB [bacterium ADurb.Bin429]